MDKNNYIKWYRIAQQEVKNEEIVPKISDDKILDFVSKADWFLFPSFGLIDREQRRSLDVPNMYFFFKENEKIQIGINYENAPAVDRLFNILDALSTSDKEDILSVLAELDDRYEFVLQKKIKDRHYAQVPDYERVLRKECNQLNDEFFKSVIEESQEIRKDGRELSDEAKSKGKYFSMVPLITIAEITVPQDESTFSDAMTTMAKVFQTCMQVKSTSKIKKMRKDRDKELKSLYKERERLMEFGPRIEFRAKIENNTEHLDKYKRKLTDVEKRIAEIEKRIK